MESDLIYRVKSILQLSRDAFNIKHSCLRSVIWLQCFPYTVTFAYLDLWPLWRPVFRNLIFGIFFPEKPHLQSIITAWWTTSSRSKPVDTVDVLRTQRRLWFIQLASRSSPFLAQNRDAALVTLAILYVVTVGHTVPQVLWEQFKMTFSQLKCKGL